MTQSTSNRLYAPRARFIVFAIFMLCAFFLGGSSRGDAPFLIALRPLSALALAYAAVAMNREQWFEFRSIFVLLMALAALMLVQLIPLPPSLWTSLPQRAPILEIGEALGANEVWRTISE